MNGITFLIAQFFGLIALIIFVISFQQNDRKVLLKLQIFSSLAFAIEYIFLGALSGFF